MPGSCRSGDSRREHGDGAQARPDDGGEGVETVEDLELIRSLGCDRVQGYLIARPMHLEQLLTWLSDRPAVGTGAGGGSAISFA
ncbi:MAG: EAL domain-containing protein [Gemmatimonadales bacterium]|nr:EAL domain-containing protein [Gemmatimonadales bacterium]MBP6571885.1 EAL domain-containing protein [Gemmatimonadales bacterium]MBP7620546.1 EAL domain-containing protein [Gemmatimonadales bacterium]